VAKRSTVVLSVIGGVLALGVAGASIALAATSTPSKPTARSTSTSSPSAPSATPGTTTPTPDPTATSPSEVLLGDTGQGVTGDAPPSPDGDAAPAPDVTPTPGPGEHVVTFQVTSSADPVQVSYYTVGGDPSSSDSRLWVYGESLPTPTWVAAPWTHSVIIPVGGDPMKDGWGLYVGVPAGGQASCRVTMDGTVISSNSVSGAGPSLGSCQPGVIK
jgi:hypothetical protein